MSAAYFKLKLLRKKRAKAQEKELNRKYRHDKCRYTGDLNIKCRICINAGSIYIYGTDLPFDVQDAIRTFGDVAIQEDDTFPKHLCENCFSQLNGAVVFRKTAKESERTLFQIQTQSTIQTNNEDSNYFGDFPEDPPNVEIIQRCETCNIGFSTAEEYSKHKSSKQHKNVRIQCSICHRVFTPQLYKNHVKTHESASHLICEVCGKLFRKDNLIRHLQLHTNELPFECQVCPYRGRFMESLKIHMRTHSGDKPFSCDKCELRFITRSNLNRHLLTHQKEKPHKCVECGRGFYTQRDLEVHFKADHSGFKDYSCTLCGNKYGTRKALMRHELRVHKRDKMAKGRLPLYLQAEYSKDDKNKECDPIKTYV